MSLIKRIFTLAKIIVKEYHYLVKLVIQSGYEVDHINNDKTDDRLENLQLLTREDNIKKMLLSRKKSLVKLICPICKKEFYFEKRNLSTRPNPCCSRQCGYKKGALTLKNRKKNVP